jgi:hypothetical protein
MNDDFEEKLLRAASASRRGDPTPAWKADILARARSAAGKRSGPPRVLVAAWAMAWAAIVLLTFATPRGADESPVSNVARSSAGQQQEAGENNPLTTPTLIALERQYHLNDLP